MEVLRFRICDRRSGGACKDVLGILHGRNAGNIGPVPHPDDRNGVLE
jgi:hypothetical protein